MMIWLKKVKQFKLKKKFKSNIIMEKTIIKFGAIEIQKQKFHQHRGPISIKNVDIDKIVVFNKVSFVKKGYKYLLVTKMLKN